MQHMITMMIKKRTDALFEWLETDKKRRGCLKMK